jgi:hypothetical protein
MRPCCCLTTVSVVAGLLQELSCSRHWCGRTLLLTGVLCTVPVFAVAVVDASSVKLGHQVW